MVSGEVFSCGAQREIPSGQDSAILPARVANHSTDLIHLFAYEASHMIEHISAKEDINRRIYLVAFTLRISSFGYKLIQEPLQKKRKLLPDSELQGETRNRQFGEVTLGPHSH